MNTLFDIQRATLAARARLADDAIGTRVDAGLVQVCRVTYPCGRHEVANVEPISDFMPADQVAAYLDRMQ